MVAGRSSYRESGDGSVLGWPALDETCSTRGELSVREVLGASQLAAVARAT